VLVERRGRHAGQWLGKSPWLQSVHFTGDVAIGDLVTVDLVQAGPNSLAGRRSADPPRPRRQQRPPPQAATGAFFGRLTLAVVVAIGVADLVVHHGDRGAVTRSWRSSWRAMRAARSLPRARATSRARRSWRTRRDPAHIVAGGSDGRGVDRLGIGHGRRQNRGEDGGGNSGEDELAHGGNSLFRPALAKCPGCLVGHETVMVRRG
jgi:hypothetical protein